MSRKRTTRRRRPADPLTRMVEMTVAAGQTIGHRSLMLAQAAGDPVALGRPEFTRMVTEKMAVAAETGVQVAGQLAAAQWGWAGWFGAQAQLGAAALAANPVTAWQHWLTASTGQAAEIGERLMADATALADASLAPAHRVVSANAKRLGRRKR
ncbi:hypothetical protein FFK22_021150 [Mycobacterium sp. KBS0706]|uniref:hypothetical protein n=1 Tax=Mycobacterium sp. KBS0706 TaxID=2578109 RepID=UPI00110FED30|nr:hypothetical protein [Mycobacterium sp. KBS0706]TSD86686.1 hypothetical protein FFK22_021150 [Mycobacterium sp. KBS0706]